MSNEILSKDCNAAVVRDLASSLAGINHAGSGASPFVILPKDYEARDMEKTLPAPLAVRANPRFSTLAGFIGYVSTFKTNDTAIFIDPDTGSTVAVIDYHGKPGDSAEARPAWGTHRPFHTPVRTVEWDRWAAKDNQWQAQRDFAEFIENNVADITKPPGAAMLDIALTFEAKTDSVFKSGIRLNNGSISLAFTGNETAKAGDKGTVEIPDTFELAVAPFRGGEAYPLTARFRYKITDGKLTLRYQLVNPHKVIEAAVLRMVDTVSTGTAIAAYVGTP